MVRRVPESGQRREHHCHLFETNNGDELHTAELMVLVVVAQVQSSRL
ncbi:MAG: hypothetical protein ABSA57_13010 [Candidatus Acidiferrales bacterium]|jgi:hypothetical protein